MEAERSTRHAQEFERKKQKLAEMRATRAQNREERMQNFLGPVQNGNPSRRETASKEDLDEILRGAGIDTEPSRSPRRPNGIENKHPDASAPAVQLNSEVIGSRNLSLELTTVSTVNIPVRDTAQYSKSIQTDDDRVPDREFSLGSQEFDFDDDMGMDSMAFRARTHSHELDSPMTDADIAQLLPSYLAGRHRHLVEDIDDGGKVKEEKKPEAVKELTEEEKNQIVNKNDFLAYFHSASKLLERVMAEKDEACKDYTLDNTLLPVTTDDLLTLVAQHHDPKWTANRAVVGISFGNQHKELVVVAYDQDRDQPHLPSGVVCVWNSSINMDTPEFSFQCNSRLTSVTFARYHQHLILAGCYSGQIALWDYRIVNKKGPANRSPLTNQTHTQPIYSIGIVGTHNSHQVVTASSEGKFCSWNIENLAQPLVARELQNKNTRTVPTVSVSFFADDLDSFVVGAEDGKVLQFNRGAIGGNNLLANREYAGHNGPVLAVHAHSAKGVVDFSHLFLTCSSDWTVKLWSNKDQMIRMRFDGHQDGVADVKWSPIHPAVFCSIDWEGLLMLWNLNENTENPVLTIDVLKGEGPLRKLAWSENGRQICVGDAKGSIYIYDVHEVLYSVKSEDFIKFSRVLAEVRQQNEEDEALNVKKESMGLAGSASTTGSSSATNVAALAGGAALSPNVKRN